MFRQAGAHHRFGGARQVRAHQYRARSQSQRPPARQGHADHRRLSCVRNSRRISRLSLAASICFEQSYSGVDGDSASSTEIYALLSALSGLPIRQDIAVTGSVNQQGDIQPIGGVNEKVEGFYDVCRVRGLTGTQGVLIPVGKRRGFDAARRRHRRRRGRQVPRPSGCPHRRGHRDSHWRGSRLHATPAANFPATASSPASTTACARWPKP